MDYILPGSSVHGILQARVLDWVAIPSPGDLPDPGIEPASLRSPALWVASSPLSHQGSPYYPWFMAQILRLRVQDGSWHFNHYNQVRGRNVEVGGKGKEEHVQLVAPFRKTFLAFHGLYILFIMAKFHGQT